MKKLLLALSLVAVVALVGCKKEEPPVPTTVAPTNAPAAPAAP